MDAATRHGRRATGWYVSFRPDARWVSARSQSAACSLTAIALAVRGSLNRDDDHLGFTTRYDGVLWWKGAEWLRAARATGIRADGDPARAP